MLEGKSVVVKKGSEWLIGYITEDGKFRRSKKIGKLSDVKEVSEYKTLKAYMKKVENPEDEDVILSTFGVERMYILDKDLVGNKEEDNIKAIEKEWWKNTNKKCLECKKKCKQSDKVEILVCKSFERKV